MHKGTPMEQAIRLAMGGRGAVEPNPMVGCILVKAGHIIGRGFHQRYGGPHAEPNALADCNPLVTPPEGATAYVNLEPCCHLNKQTPPCVPKLIAARISRVVIGCLDPNPSVAGEGVRQLRAAGIDVTVGDLEDRARQLNAAYFARVVHHRPYVTLKWAESADGKVAGPMGKRATISNDNSLQIVHILRSRCDAILVGIRTVLNDDPLLTARPKSGAAAHRTLSQMVLDAELKLRTLLKDDPLLTVRAKSASVPARTLLRVVLDPELKLPLDGRLARSGDQGPIVVYCSEASHQNHARIVELTNRKIEVVPLPAVGNQLSLPDLMVDLHHRAVTHLLVEPGPGLARAFLASGLVDRVWLFRSPNRIDDATAPAAEPIPMRPVAGVDIFGDHLTEYLNPASPVFFAPVHSADVALLASYEDELNRRGAEDAEERL
jgi:diaminohydroxyphosphoribosylaminopyrimidine deaminase / 5-amino-6-(5-phosphoribosylamino)uracil reductase